MLKNIILTGFSLASIFGMNLIFIDNDLNINNTKKNMYHDIKKSTKSKDSNSNFYVENEINISTIVNNKEKNSSNIEGYIRRLKKEAEDFTDKAKYTLAIAKYDEIIKITKKSQKVKFLKIFAGVSFLKAYIYYYYKNSEDRAIDIYNSVIERFKYSSNIELLKLYFKAQKNKILLLNDKNQKIEIYNEIIDKFKDSTEDELIKMYIYAQEHVAYLMEDKNSKVSIEIYENIIEKTKDSNNEELKRAMINAENNKIRYLIANDKIEEAIEAYDEIIDKTKDDSRFYNDTTTAMLAKSFFLSTTDKIRALDILDDLIAKELSKGNTKSTNFECAIINAIELSIILDIDDSKYKNLLNRYIRTDENEETMAEYEMLEILQNAQYSNQDNNIIEWDKKYKNVKLYNWDFGNLEDWISQIENIETRNRIINYLNYFEAHS
jgi:tetratricopeptide (TPR) repeat protein